MAELIINVLKEINIGQLLVIGAMIWFFYNRLDQKLESKSNDLSARIDKLSERVEDIDRRLCRIEGSLATQGHCLYSQINQPEKKAG